MNLVLNRLPVNCLFFWQIMLNSNFIIMKRSMFFFVLLAAAMTISAQNSVIDKVFAKYSGQEGITSVSISPDLFKIAAAYNEGHDGDEDFPVEKISSLKVLTVEDEGKISGTDFYNEVLKDLNVSEYQEVMSVREGSDNVKMLMKTDGRQIFEFIILTGGDDSALVYIAGNFSMDDLENVAQSAGSITGHN